MKRNTAWLVLVLILLGAFFLRQYRLLDFPYHGDEVDEGDIALDILHGHLAPFYPQNEGNEALYQFVLAPFFAVLGDSVIANRFPSAAWSTVLVALMYLYGRVLFKTRRTGVLAAGLAAALWWPTVFGRLGLREISQPVMMTPALLGLVLILRAHSPREAWRAAVMGGAFAGLTAYTFLSGRGFPVIVVLFLGYAALAQRERLRQRWRAFLLYAILMIGLTIPLYAYWAMHPELDYHLQELGRTSWLAQGNLALLVPQVLNTVGMFTVRGDMNWVRNIAGRPVFVGPEGWLFYLGIVLCLWRWRRPEYALQLIVLATMLAPNVIAEDPPRWTRSIGILPGLLITPALSVEWLLGHIERWAGALAAPGRRMVPALSVILVVALGLSIYTRTALDMFQTWINNPGVYWMTLAFYDGTGQYINHSPETTPVNYVMDVYTPWRQHNIQRPVQRPEVALRYSVNYALALADDPRGWRIAFQIMGAPAPALLQAFLNLDSPIYVDARVDPEGRHPLHVYELPRERLDEHLSRAAMNPIFLPGTATLWTTPLQVGGDLQFLGYEILDPTTQPGNDLHVLTYWRVLQLPPEMAVFLHLLDSHNKVVAQFDGLDVVTDSLAPGDTIVQLHTLTLPGDLHGAYRFELGAYTRADLQRLPLNTGTDHVWLQTWRAP